MPKAMLAELPAVIAPEHDDRVVGETFFIESVKHFADLCIGVADAGIVAVAQCFREFSRDGIILRHARVSV